MHTSEALKFSSAWYRSKGKDDIIFSVRGTCSMVTKNASPFLFFSFLFFFLPLVSMRLALREPVVASLAHGQPESEKETPVRSLHLFFNSTYH